jgi:hypothetical protein
MPVIPAFGSLRQEDQKFKVSLGYIARPHLKITAIKKKKESVPPGFLEEREHVPVRTHPSDYTLLCPF